MINTLVSRKYYLFLPYFFKISSIADYATAVWWCCSFCCLFVRLFAPMSHFSSNTTDDRSKKANRCCFILRWNRSTLRCVVGWWKSWYRWTLAHFVFCSSFSLLLFASFSPDDVDRGLSARPREKLPTVLRTYKGTGKNVSTSEHCGFATLE